MLLYKNPFKMATVLVQPHFGGPENYGVPWYFIQQMNELKLFIYPQVDEAG